MLDRKTDRQTPRQGPKLNLTREPEGSIQGKIGPLSLETQTLCFDISGSCEGDPSGRIARFTDTQSHSKIKT